MKLAALQSAVIKWSPCKKEKEHCLNEFSVDSWKNLCEAKKKEHTLLDCKGCHQNYPSVQALFPVVSTTTETSQRKSFCQDKGTRRGNDYKTSK